MSGSPSIFVPLQDTSAKENMFEHLAKNLIRIIQQTYNHIVSSATSDMMRDIIELKQVLSNMDTDTLARIGMIRYQSCNQSDGIYKNLKFATNRKNTCFRYRNKTYLRGKNPGVKLHSCFTKITSNGNAVTINLHPQLTMGILIFLCLQMNFMKYMQEQVNKELAFAFDNEPPP